MEILENRPSISELVDTVSKSLKLNHYKIVDVKTNKKGEGFLGQIFMVTVKNLENDDQLEILVKAAFTNARIRETAPIAIAFKNEVYFYLSAYPKLHNFGKRHNIFDVEKLVPKCYGASNGHCDEMLALENLKTNGFTTFNKREILDHNHLKLIFESYGIFHAYSYALRDQNPEEYLKIVDNTENIYVHFARDAGFKSHLTDLSQTVENCCLVPGEDDTIIEAYKKYSGEKLVNVFEEVCGITDPSFCFIHGDCWSNNMLFQYEGTLPISVRLIDWQLIKEGSPACDLSYCLYSGGDKKAFDNLDEYLRTYYDSFSATLKKFGSNPEKLFSFDTLQQHWCKYAKFGMAMALGIIKIKVTSDADIYDFTDLANEEDISKFKDIKYDKKKFQKRIRELLSHLFEIGAL